MSGRERVQGAAVRPSPVGHGGRTGRPVTTNDAVAKARQTVDYWERHPDSFPARLYARMLAGEWVTSDDAVAEGKNGSNVSQQIMVMRQAGLPVQSKSTGVERQGVHLAAVGRETRRRSPGKSRAKRTRT